MTEKQLNDLLEKYAPQIRDSVLAGIRDLRDNALLIEIIKMIEMDNIEGALRALGYNPAVFSATHMTIMQTFEQGALVAIGGLPKYSTSASGVRTPTRFNVRDPRAEKWLSERSSTLITEIESDVRQAVRGTIQAGLTEGRNPRDIALDVVGRYDRTTGHREGGMVGLSSQGQYWAAGARTRLLNLDPSYFNLTLRDKRFDTTVQRAIDEQRPLPVDVVDKLVDRYRARALQYRGEMIGRTEALAALNTSEYEAIRQALAQSDLPLDAAKKIWDSASDNRVRHSHKVMDGQTVGLGEAFVSPVTGARMMHPHDTTLGAPASEVVACRCKVRYEIDYLYRYRTDGAG